MDKVIGYLLVLVALTTLYFSFFTPDRLYIG